MVSNEGVQKTAQAINGGWFDLFKERIQFDAIVDKAWASKNIIIDIVLYGSIGFLAGFLFKKHSQYLIFSILFVSGFLILQQFNIISVIINWQKIHALMGTQPTGMVSDNLLIFAWEWIKANLVVTLSFVVGFLAGLKIG